jgi:hypothetical protein
MNMSDYKAFRKAYCTLRETFGVEDSARMALCQLDPKAKLDLGVHKWEAVFRGKKASGDTAIGAAEAVLAE